MSDRERANISIRISNLERIGGMYISCGLDHTKITNEIKKLKDLLK